MTLFVLALGRYSVRAVVRSEGVWFVGRDVCAALGLKNHLTALARIPDEQKAIHRMDTLGGAQRVTVICQRGVQRLAFSSRTSAALELQRWIGTGVPQDGSAATLIVTDDEQCRLARRGMRAAALSDLEFRLLETLHGMKRRPAVADWLIGVLRISDSALHGLVHRLRKKLLPLDYEIINCRAEGDVGGAYLLSDLTRTAKGRAA